MNVLHSQMRGSMPDVSFFLVAVAGNNESVEPFTSNMYSRRVLAGEFTVRLPIDLVVQSRRMTSLLGISRYLV